MTRPRTIVGALVFAFFALMPALTLAQTATSTASSTSAAALQAQIDAQNAQISQLDTEIAQYQTQLTAASQQQQTLQSQLDQIQLSVKKTNASIEADQDQITSTKLQIQQLAGGIQNAQASVATTSAGLAESIRVLNEEEAVPIAVQVLSADSLSEMWNDVEVSASLQGAMGSAIQQLQSQEQTLSDTKTESEQKQSQLEEQESDLVTQQGSLSAQQSAQSQLLAQTKSQESTYENIIAQKQSQEASLQAALGDLKSQYNEAVNPSAVPTPSPGILQWPIAGQITITQFFGDTPFAQANPSVYSGHGHDGLDIAVPIGTPVHAALSGVVLATGNTDLVHDADGDQCYSFGKWIMLKHDNGLNTMYAHLSEIDVTPGQQVSTGDVIGYSGETGYATGPHLHFGVYVSSVTQIIQLGVATEEATPCATAVMPVPPLAGYLNPLNYLPTVNFINDTGE